MLIIDSYKRLEPDGFLVDDESYYNVWAGTHGKYEGKFYGMRHRET
jgi:hypothetical protein